MCLFYREANPRGVSDLPATKGQNRLEEFPGGGKLNLGPKEGSDMPDAGRTTGLDSEKYKAMA